MQDLDLLAIHTAIGRRRPLLSSGFLGGVRVMTSKHVSKEVLTDRHRDSSRLFILFHSIVLTGACQDYHVEVVEYIDICRWPSVESLLVHLLVLSVYTDDVRGGILQQRNKSNPELANRIPIKLGPSHGSEYRIAQELEQSLNWNLMLWNYALHRPVPD